MYHFYLYWTFRRGSRILIRKAQTRTAHVTHATQLSMLLDIFPVVIAVRHL